MNTHVTMPGAKGEMDAQVVDIRETEREFPADLSPLEPTDMNMVTRAKEILCCTAHELVKGHRRAAAPRWSAPAELYPMCASPSYMSVGPRLLEGIGVEEITKSAKKYTRATLEWVSVVRHAQRALHTSGSAHCSNGTLMDNVLCPWWRSLFTTTKKNGLGGRGRTLLSGTASFADEGGKERCWKVSPVFVHGCDVQGRLLDGAETTKRSGLSAQGHDGEHTFMVETRIAQGDVGGSTHILLVFR